MSYTRKVGDMVIFIDCISNPEATYDEYYKEIEAKIIADGYNPKTTMDNLISMIILSFDCESSAQQLAPRPQQATYIQ